MNDCEHEPCEQCDACSGAREPETGPETRFGESPQYYGDGSDGRERNAQTGCEGDHDRASMGPLQRGNNRVAQEDEEADVSDREEVSAAHVARRVEQMA